MSKRIEELEKEIKERKNKRYNCNWDFIKSSQNIYDLQARIQERKLAEKEFKEDREALELYVRTKELEVEKLKKELGK